jgi:hypothetical protein
VEVFKIINEGKLTFQYNDKEYPSFEEFHFGRLESTVYETIKEGMIPFISKKKQ